MCIPRLRGVVEQIVVAGLEDVLGHLLDLAAEDVLQPIFELARLIALAAELEAGHQAALRERIPRGCRYFSDNRVLEAHRNHVGQTHDPHIRLVTTLPNRLRLINMEKLGM